MIWQLKWYRISFFCEGFFVIVKTVLNRASLPKHTKSTYCIKLFQYEFTVSTRYLKEWTGSVKGGRMETRFLTSISGFNGGFRLNITDVLLFSLIFFFSQWQVLLKFNYLIFQYRMKFVIRNNKTKIEI